VASYRANFSAPGFTCHSVSRILNDHSHLLIRLLFQHLLRHAGNSSNEPAEGYRAQRTAPDGRAYAAWRAAFTAPSSAPRCRLRLQRSALMSFSGCLLRLGFDISTPGARWLDHHIVIFNLPAVDHARRAGR